MYIPRHKKSIKSYSNVDLLEVLIDKNHSDYQAAMEELKSRNLSDEELEITKCNLQTRLRVRNKPLSLRDKIIFLVIPLLAPQSPFINNLTEIDNAYDKLEEEFAYYGEKRKMAEIAKWRRYGHTIYFSILLLICMGAILWRWIKE